MRALPSHQRYASLPWLIVTMTVVAVAIGTIAARYVESRLVASKGESLALAAAEIAHKLDLLLAEQYDDTLELSRTQVFRKRGVDAQSAYLATVKNTHPIYLWLGVTDAGGRIVSATDPASVGQDRSQSPWFQAARKTGTVHVNDVEPFVEAGGTDAFSFTAPITGPGGEFQGVVTTRVGLPHLEDVVARTLRTFQGQGSLGGTLEYKFVTSTGDVFIDSDLLHKGNVNLKRIGLPSTRLSESGQPGYVEEEHLQRHVPVITGYALTQGTGEFPGLKWAVLLRTDKDDLVVPIRSVLWKLAAAWVLVWLPMLAFVLWTTARLRKEQAQAREEHAHAATAEANYRQLVEQARDVIYRTDAEGHFTFVNQTASRIMGYFEQELLGRRFVELIRPDARESAERFYGRQVVRRTPSTYYEFPAVTKDGREIWFGQNVQLLLEHGQAVGVHAVARDITARKRAEEKLLLSQEIVANAHDPISIMDLQGRFTYQNSSHASLIGFSNDELLGKTPALFLGDEAFASICQELTRTQSYRGEVIARTKDGALKDLDLSVFTIRDTTNKPACYVAIKRDVTERKREGKIIQALLEGTASVTGEQFFSALVHALAKAFGVRHAFVTELLEDEPPRLRMLAIWADDRLGSPTEYDPVRTPCENVIKLGEAYYQHSVQELFPLDKDLVALKAVSYLGIALVDSSGRTIGHLCIVDDQPLPDQHHIAPLLKVFSSRAAAELERKRVDEALRESEKRFRTIFDQAPLGIAVIDSTTGQFRRINRKYCDIVGYPHQDMLARTFQDITHPDDLQADLDNMKRLMEGQIHSFRMEKRYFRKDGTIVWVNLTCVPLWWDYETEHRFHIAMVEDITERKQAEEKLRERSRQQAIQAELSLLAVTTPDLSILLNTVAGLTANALELDYCEVLELLPNGRHLLLRAGVGWKNDLIGQATTDMRPSSLASITLHLNDPVIVQDLPGETRFSGPSWLRDHGIVSGMSVTIHGKEDPWGTLGVYTTRRRSFSRDDINFLQTVSSILATAIERAQAEDVLRNANQALRTLSRQLLQVQEDDRRAIARDLHDEIGQSLTAIKLNVERAQRTSDRAARTRIMQDCSQITDNVLEQVRNLSLDLHPSILDDLGLAYALKWYADRQAERARLDIQVTADPALPRLPRDIEIACFRIAQEALTNVVRHARARRASVTLKRGKASVELSIWDDGTGFVVDVVSPLTAGRTSIGLTSMQERARLLHGEVKITSVPGQGTEVIALLPLPSTPPADTPAEKAP